MLVLCSRCFVSAPVGTRAAISACGQKIQVQIWGAADPVDPGARSRHMPHASVRSERSPWRRGAPYGVPTLWLAQGTPQACAGRAHEGDRTEFGSTGLPYCRTAAVQRRAGSCCRQSRSIPTSGSGCSARRDGAEGAWDPRRRACPRLRDPCSGPVQWDGSKVTLRVFQCLSSLQHAAGRAGFRLPACGGRREGGKEGR